MAPAQRWRDDGAMSSVDRIEDRANHLVDAARGRADMTTNQHVRARAVSTVASPFANDEETVSEYVRRTRPKKVGSFTKARARWELDRARLSARHPDSESRPVASTGRH
jgi:hypothetical protein